MSDTLTDLLTRFPNCRVTIASSRPARKKPYEGQLKVLARKGRMIRVPRKAYWGNGRVIGNQVRNGRPLYDWVPEASLSASDRKLYQQLRLRKGDPE